MIINTASEAKHAPVKTPKKKGEWDSPNVRDSDDEELEEQIEQIRKH